jgi:hypothetical protein
MTRSTRSGADPERGTGLLSSAFGVTIFLAFLLLAVQVLFHLHTSSATAGVALEGARVVAAAGTDPAAVADAQALATAEVRGLLGDAGDDAVLDWSASTSDEVVLTITVRGARVLPPQLADPIGFEVVTRTARVRREGVR